MRSFLKRNKKTIMNITFVLLSLVAVSIISMIVLSAFDILYYEGDGIKLNTEIFNSFMNYWYGWLIIILLQVAITTLLCFIPGASMAFIMLIQALSDKPWQAFLIAFGGVMLSSAIMYLTGYFGGNKVCEKILGKSDCQRASELLNHKGAVYFPFMMMFPIFPDDALIMIAGTLKMSMKWFIPSIVIGRGIGIFTIIFGLSIIPYDRFTTPWHWIGFVAICIVLVALVFYLAFRFNKFLESKKKDKENKE